MSPPEVSKHFQKVSSKTDVVDIVYISDIDVNDIMMWTPKKTTLLFAVFLPLGKIHFIPFWTQLIFAFNLLYKLFEILTTLVVNLKYKPNKILVH